MPAVFPECNPYHEARVWQEDTRKCVNAREAQLSREHEIRWQEKAVCIGF